MPSSANSLLSNGIDFYPFFVICPGRRVFPGFNSFFFLLFSFQPVVPKRCFCCSTEYFNHPTCRFFTSSRVFLSYSPRCAVLAIWDLLGGGYTASGFPSPSFSPPPPFWTHPLPSFPGKFSLFSHMAAQNPIFLIQSLPVPFRN